MTHSPDHAERAAIERAVEYMRHGGHCGFVGGYDRCTCGMEEARVAMLAYADERVAAALSPTGANNAQVAGRDAVVEDRQAAVELVEWWDTGILRDGVVRAEAKAMLAAEIADEQSDVRQAERAIMDRIVRRAAIDTVRGEGENG